MADRQELTAFPLWPRAKGVLVAAPLFPFRHYSPALKLYTGFMISMISTVS